MTKYQEKRFKDYIECIEDLTRDIADSIQLGILSDLSRQVKERRKIKTSFFNWFKKQTKNNGKTIIQKNIGKNWAKRSGSK